MKKILLVCIFSLCYSTGVLLNAATTATPAMDPNEENDLINQITSIQYAEIGQRIRALDKIQMQAKRLSYVSPAVQANYYAAATKVFSDLMATTDKSFANTIRKFMGVLTSCLSSKILDANQKNLMRSYTAQLTQQYQTLTTKSQKTIAKGQKTTSPVKPGRVK